MRSAVHERVAGGRIYDSHIAEVARRTGAEVVVTANRRHFSALMQHGIRVLAPEEWSAELEL
jgi:predicted nucleic acid-binding protein